MQHQTAIFDKPQIHACQLRCWPCRGCGRHGLGWVSVPSTRFPFEVLRVEAVDPDEEVDLGMQIYQRLGGKMVMTPPSPYSVPSISADARRSAMKPRHAPAARQISGVERVPMWTMLL